MPRTLLFDLDGTLTDPKPGIVRSIQYALKKLGVAAPAGDDLTWCIGPPLLESLGHLVGDAHAAEALTLYRERFSDIGWRENAVYPGIPELLRERQDAGDQLLIATSKPHVYAERIVQHFGLAARFERVFGAELDGTRADKGELIRFALSETSSDKPALMIGDRKHDIIGAQKNGIASIGVTYGYGGESELLQAGADQIVHSPRELLATLQTSSALERAAPHPNT